MELQNTFIEDTFAEAFDMRFVRLIVTADDEYWLQAAIRELTGFSASVIACDVESGLECYLEPSQTPDGRVGAAVLMFGFSRQGLGQAVPTRVGQCVMTCPSTAAFDGIPDADEQIPLGKHLRFFGDGYQKSKLIDGRRYWRIPVMDGEFLVEERLGVGRGVAGGNLIIQTTNSGTGRRAARRSIDALANMPGIIAPFPGGVVRSGSKVGSRYKKLKASTNDSYCPTLRGRAQSKLLPDVNCSYEIVLDGTDFDVVANALQAALRAAAGDGVVAISAGNYGGKLGKHHFHLRRLLKETLA